MTAHSDLPPFNAAKAKATRGRAFRLFGLVLVVLAALAGGYYFLVSS